MGKKLARDRIFDVPWRDEETKEGIRRYTRPVADAEEHGKLLRQKLLEEVGELVVADSPDEFLDEAADVFEVLRALVMLAGFDMNHFYEVADDKRDARGGFSQGLVWET